MILLLPASRPYRLPVTAGRHHGEKLDGADPAVKIAIRIPGIHQGEEIMAERPMQDQVALVTGGAGGIGSGICRRLAEAGASVVLTGRDAAKLAAAAKALPGGGHWGTTVSVTDSAALADLAGEVERRYGRLDLLVNNAGVTKLVKHDDLDGLTDDLIDEIFRVNWRGPFACVRAFRHLLEAGDGGVVVNISSNAALTGKGSNIAYSSSKAAVNSMTLSLARVFAPKVRVFAIAPGFVDTGFVSRDPAWVEAAVQTSLMKRRITPEALGDAVVAAVTHMRFSTGCVIPVDGGPL
jgi:3-oxoacyl-[acyl-carrier protein] reductase